MTNSKKSLLLLMLSFVLVLSAFTFIYTDYSYAATKAPSKVTLSKAVKVNSSSIKVTWKKLSKNCTGYQIYKSTKKKSGYKLVADIDSNSTTSYKVEGLSPYTTYYFKVRSVYKIEKAPASEDAEAVYKTSYGKFSKVKSARTSKKKVVVPVYETIHVGDTVYFTNGITLFTYDINTEKISDTGLNAYWYMFYEDGYIYTQPHSTGLGDENMPLYIINTKTMKTTTLKKTAGKGFGKIGDEVLYYVNTKAYLKYIKSYSTKPFKGDMYLVKAYNVKTKKTYTKNKYTLEVKPDYDGNGTNDPDYYVETSWDDDWCAYFHTPTKKFRFSDEWNVN